MIFIHEEKQGDVSALQAIHEQTFGQQTEANIVDQLRSSCDGLLSLVGEYQGQVVGHILFSPAVIGGSDTLVQGMGLAPLSVLPGASVRPS